MTDASSGVPLHPYDTAPGDKPPSSAGARDFLVNYLIGLVLALGLTATAYLLVIARPVWLPSIPIAILVLAIAQMAIHVVFFLQLTSGPESASNIMALAFGVLIVVLLMVGSLWIMSNLDHRMAPPLDKLLQMQH
jgi:cytochrome o ubiquinol oxidase subunit IV